MNPPWRDAGSKRPGSLWQKTRRPRALAEHHQRLPAGPIDPIGITTLQPPGYRSGRGDPCYDRRGGDKTRSVRGGVRSSASMHRLKAAVLSFFAWAEKNGIIQENPVSTLTLRRLSRTPPAQGTPQPLGPIDSTGPDHHRAASRYWHPAGAPFAEVWTRKHLYILMNYR
jgi:hypothetical protein